MRRRLFRGAAAAEADVRPTLLGVVTLLFLLLFFLLSTSSGQRLGVIDLRLGTVADLAPLPHAGLLQSVEVRLDGAALVVLAEVQTTDISASSTTVEQRRVDIPPTATGPDLARLVEVVDGLHALDGAQTRARLQPGDEVDTGTLVALLDVLRGSAEAPRFPEVALVGVEG